MNISREALQADLLAVFERYHLSVAVGMTAKGVAIRSQDECVDAANVGNVRALDDRCARCGRDLEPGLGCEPCAEEGS